MWPLAASFFLPIGRYADDENAHGITDMIPWANFFIFFVIIHCHRHIYRQKGKTKAQEQQIFSKRKGE